MLHATQAGEVDAYLATAPAEVVYLSGFRGSNGWLLVGPRILLLTDGRYREQAASEAGGCDVVIASGGLGRALGDEVGGLRRIAFDPSRVTVALHEELTSSLPDVEWVAKPGVVDALRLRKDGGEIDAIERALTIAEAALVEVASGVEPGDREREIAARIEYSCRCLGAERMSFEPIVAAGARGALPHARPESTRVAEGDLLVVDIGCVVDGYCSDITRAVVVGAELEPDWLRIWEAVAAAQSAALAAVRPGVSAQAVDAAARQVLAEAGLAEAFVHSLGHGVGLEIHEAPRLAERSDDVLEAGMVVTIEPGVYLAGSGGIRLEDMVVVEEAGARRLNALPVDPIYTG